MFRRIKDALLDCLRLLGQTWHSGHTHLCALTRSAFRGPIVVVPEFEIALIDRSPWLGNVFMADAR